MLATSTLWDLFTGSSYESLDGMSSTLRPEPADSGSARQIRRPYLEDDPATRLRYASGYAPVFFTECSSDIHPARYTNAEEFWDCRPKPHAEYRRRLRESYRQYPDYLNISLDRGFLGVLRFESAGRLRRIATGNIPTLSGFRIAILN